MMSEQKIQELLRTKRDGSLYHRESRELEFKEQFNLAGLAEYFRDFAAFANNIGGFLIFGVTNNPRKLKGLTKQSAGQFKKIDPERISGFLKDIFEPEIIWKQEIYTIKKKQFGVFYIYPSPQKPVIAKKNEGRDQVIKSGEIYYRYGGRTDRIQFSELYSMIQERLELQNKNWKELIAKIAKVDPSNAAILDVEKGVIEKNENQVLVIDKKLLDKIQFVKEGKFSEKDGAKTLKLVGDVQPVDSIEVVKIQARRLTDLYPLSATELVNEIKRRIPKVKQNRIWEVIKENDIKNNSNYSAYNFRNKAQEEEYKRSGRIPAGTPSIYNMSAVNFIETVLKG